jgi:hypothetical protein
MTPSALGNMGNHEPSRPNTGKIVLRHIGIGSTMAAY